MIAVLSLLIWLYLCSRTEILVFGTGATISYIC